MTVCVRLSLVKVADPPIARLGHCEGRGRLGGVWETAGLRSNVTGRFVELATISTTLCQFRTFLGPGAEYYELTSLLTPFELNGWIDLLIFLYRYCGLDGWPDGWKDEWI